MPGAVSWISQKEQNSIKLNNTSMAWRWDPRVPPQTEHDMAKLCPCSHIDFLRNSITLSNEQPVLVDRIGSRVRAIYCSGNVSHFHEYWMECATVGRLSLSLWFVCLPPTPSSSVTFSCSLKLIFVLSPQSVWVRSIPGQRLMQTAHITVTRYLEKCWLLWARKHPRNLFSHELPSMHSQYLHRPSKSSILFARNDVNVVMATILTHYPMLIHSMSSTRVLFSR